MRSNGFPLKILNILNIFYILKCLKSLQWWKTSQGHPLRRAWAQTSRYIRYQGSCFSDLQWQTSMNQMRQVHQMWPARYWMHWPVTTHRFQPHLRFLATMTDIFRHLIIITISRRIRSRCITFIKRTGSNTMPMTATATFELPTHLAQGKGRS